MSLKKQAIGGVKWTAIAAIFSAVLQLLQISILARFLNKTDFGLMAIALFVIGISQIFVDMGISNAIIYKQKVNKYQLSTLFWLNILIGIGVYFLIFVFAPLFARFYHTPRLTQVLRSIGITFLIIPVGQLFETVLRRDLMFRSLSNRDIIAKIVGFVVAVILAIRNYGVDALIYANLATAIVSTFLLVFAGVKIFKPKLLFSWRSLQQHGFFSFGLYQIGEQLVNYFNSQFDTLLIGKLIGMEALGVYNIAKTLANRPYQILNPIITKVAFPVFAKLQNDVKKLKQAYLRIIQILTLSNAPIYACLFAFSREIVALFFGNQWELAAPLLQLLAISSLSNSIGNPIGSLQLARGRADLGFYWNVGLFILMPVSMYIGSYWGLLGVASCLVVMKVALQIPAWYFFVRPLSNAGFNEYFSSFLKPIIAVAFCITISYITTISVNNPNVRLLAALTIFFVSYITTSLFFYKSLIVDYLPDIQMFRKWRA